MAKSKSKKSESASQKKLKAQQKTRKLERQLAGTSLARQVAPEDLRAGDYVATLGVIGELVPIVCAPETYKTSVQTIRYEYMDRDCEPMKVVGICLPFVLVQDSEGDRRTIDVRRYRLARLPWRYAKPAMALLQQQEPKFRLF